MTTSARTGRLARLWMTPRTWFGSVGSVDHKIIGLRYLATALLFLLLGGVEALVMRVQLSRADAHLVSAETYAQLFTLHGVTMMFLFALPVLSGFSNYLWPLMLGARDMALPRVNALSYWLFLFSGVFIYVSVPLGLAPDAGWFNYVPLSSAAYLPRSGIDFFALGLVLAGISTTTGAINFIVTFARMRAPGMSVARVPIIIWGTLTASAAALFALPSLTVACLFLFLDRHEGTHFFDAALGGKPLLWQQLFWMFGHPWVYIVVLPAMSIASQIIPTFCRVPLVGYRYVASATVAVGGIGFTVWAHHMFATGMAPTTMAFFSAASMMITIPSAITMFAWVATIWVGRPVMRTPFLFMVGFLVIFIIGGVSGVMTASAPFDWQLTQSYFVVAHLHYVLIGINLFPVFGAIYYWFPKFTGRLMNERVGRVSFWTMFAGFNIGFFPMHIVGMLGMPRRIYTYAAGLGWDNWNLLITAGAFLFALGLLATLVNMCWSWRSGAVTGANPWNAATLEWSVPSPPPPYNFASIPQVASREPLWESDAERARSVLASGPALEHGHEVMTTTMWRAERIGALVMPGDSASPFYLALATLMVFEALLWQQWIVAVVAVMAAIAALAAWLWPDASAAPARVGATVDAHPPGEWAMALLIATEAALFASLLFSWAYLANGSKTWLSHPPPPLALPAVNTVILLISSATLHWGLRRSRNASATRTRSALAATIALGIIFVILQGWEYGHQAFGPATDAYGSAFVVITGIHGMHVVVGLLMLGFVALTFGRDGGDGGDAAQRRTRLVALYWHFVDVVWLLVFGILYAARHLTK
jgi:cytochrome c oxidase subunit I+III